MRGMVEYMSDLEEKRFRRVERWNGGGRREGRGNGRVMRGKEGEGDSRGGRRLRKGWRML